MPTVPITPARPVAVARTSASAPGAMTSRIGTGIVARSSSSPAAAAVLQATMTTLAPCSSTRLRANSSANLRTSSAGRGP
ncbi:MAG: hypothetical protein WKF58_04970 [Ilumatobacteraceae bacterium]